MNGAISEVDDFFRMSQGEAGAAAFMTGIGAGGCIAFT
jgi:galactokinase